MVLSNLSQPERQLDKITVRVADSHIHVEATRPHHYRSSSESTVTKQHLHAHKILACFVLKQFLGRWNKQITELRYILAMMAHFLFF